MMLILFYFLFALVLWVYLGYPIFLFLMGVWSIKINKENNIIYDVSNDQLPKVSVIISCYNEDSVIGEKIDNTLNINYPSGLLEIIIISDGSTDKTVEIAKSYKDENLRVYARAKNEGKTAVQNYAAMQAKGDILVFTDADAFLKEDSLIKIVTSFKTNNVAGVGGEVIFKSETDESIGSQENLFRKYEVLIKKLENRYGNLIGFTGAIYAIRKNNYIYLRNEEISDFIESVKLSMNGYKIIYEPSVIAIEKVEYDYRKEYHRKMRTILRGLHSIRNNYHVINPFKYGMLSIQIISHKLLRWFVPIALLGLFICSLLQMNQQVLIFSTFILQVIFYFMALIGWVLQKFSSPHSNKLIDTSFYFCLVNFASFMAIYNFLRGKNIIRWIPQRS